MNFGKVGPLSDIPYLAKADLRGRFVASLAFYDGDWQMWLETQAGTSFVKVQAWPAEAFYFAAAPENPNDIYSEFLNFIAV